MICSTVPEEEKQNHEEGVKSWLYVIVRWTRVGRHSEGVSHVPACPVVVVVVVAEADRQHRGPRANSGGRANAPDSGYWRHKGSRNSTESGSKTALDPALSPGDRRAREPLPPGSVPSARATVHPPRAPSPVPPTPRAPPTSPRAPDLPARPRPPRALRPASTCCGPAGARR